MGVLFPEFFWNISIPRTIFMNKKIYQPFSIRKIISIPCKRSNFQVNITCDECFISLIKKKQTEMLEASIFMAEQVDRQTWLMFRIQQAQIKMGNTGRVQFGRFW